MRIDESDFEFEMSEVDKVFADAKVPIAARPIQAMIAIFKRHQTTGLLSSFGELNLIFPINETNLCDHVGVWYETRYGAKLNIDPSLGRFPLLLEGAAYECRIPLIIGSRIILTAKDQMVGQMILNTLDHVIDLPSLVRERLSDLAEAEIQALFITCANVSQKLGRLKQDFIISAKSDMLLSSDLICGYSVNASLSAWHSLQFAEKVIKHYISSFKTPARTHDIAKLMTMAEQHGLPKDKRIDLGLFSFDASVRYEPNQIDVERAVRINHEAWRIAYNILIHSKS